MDNLAASWSLPTALGWLALARIWVGAIWAMQGIEMFLHGDFRDLTPKLSRMVSTNLMPRLYRMNCATDGRNPCAVSVLPTTARKIGNVQLSDVAP